MQFYLPPLLLQGILVSLLFQLRVVAEGLSLELSQLASLSLPFLGLKVITVPPPRAVG